MKIFYASTLFSFLLISSLSLFCSKAKSLTYLINSEVSLSFYFHLYSNFSWLLNNSSFSCLISTLPSSTLDLIALWSPVSNYIFSINSSNLSETVALCYMSVFSSSKIRQVVSYLRVWFFISIWDSKASWWLSLLRTNVKFLARLLWTISTMLTSSNYSPTNISVIIEFANIICKCKIFFSLLTYSLDGENRKLD